MKNKTHMEFHELWDTTVARVRAYIYCICRDRDHVDDLAQECYYRAFRNWDQFQRKGPRQAWLLIIAKRTCIDWFRSKKNEDFVSLETSGEIPQIISDNQDFDQIEAIWKAIHSLQSEYKEVLYLRFAGELNYADIAETLDIPTGTVRSRLHRGLKMLKVQFQEK
jgi:RNA polymerase sigma-70 factor (ECF subfamily)